MAVAILQISLAVKVNPDVFKDGSVAALPSGSVVFESICNLVKNISSIVVFARWLPQLTLDPVAQPCLLASKSRSVKYCD